MIRQLAFCLSLLLAACGEPEPVRVRPAPLVNSAAFPPEQREAVYAVARYLEQNGENPVDFFAEIPRSLNKDELVFRLWHADSLDTKHMNFVGNPGGKNRDVTYDAKARKVTRMTFWQ